MKKNKFSLSVLAKQKVRPLPGTLNSKSLRTLLKSLEVGDEEYADSELLDVVAMSLEDVGEQSAVAAILESLYPLQFTPGQIQNLTEELKEEAAWEEYADLNDHEALYVCVDLLNNSFPKEYRAPSHTKLSLFLEGVGLEKYLHEQTLPEAVILRAISQLDNSECRVCRLFHEQLKGGAFPEASSILWILDLEMTDSDKLEAECHGSSYWFAGIEKGMSAEVVLP